MIINQQGLSALFTSYKGNFKTGWGRAKPEWKKIATLIPSKTTSNLYAFLGQFPQLRLWAGDRQIKNLKAHDYTVINDPFESTVEVDRDNMEDDTFGVFAPMFEEMGYAASMHPDSLLFALMAAGATELCYDGQAFFDASHPVTVDEVASTDSNYDVTGGGNLWALMDTKHPLKPMIFQKRRDYKFTSMVSPTDTNVFMRKSYLYGIDSRVNVGFGLWQMAYGSLNTLNATNVDLYMAAGFALKSDEGHPLNVKYDTIVCGPSNWAAARNLITQQFLATGETNPHHQMFDILVTPYLT